MTNEDRLKDAAISGDINSLYTLIQENPRVLEHFDDVPFVDTPLHFAASAGHLPFAAEIMRLKPSFARKLNQEGFSPIHLALQHGQYRMVLSFVKMDKNLVRVKGKEGITPLHFVTQIGETDLLGEFLNACPDSIEDVTVRGETALHIAGKHKQNEAVEKLVLWLTQKKQKGAAALENKMLNWGDEAGNTILHISAYINDLRGLQLLIHSKIDLNAKNLEMCTAIDIAATEEIKSILKPSPHLHKLLRLPSEFLPYQNIRKVRQRMDISEDIRNALLVVVTVVATATYQAALSPPGGLYQANKGTNNDMSHLKTYNTSMNWKPNIGIGGNSIIYDTHKTWGCIAHVRIQDPKRPKMEPRTITYIYLGSVEDSAANRFLDLSTNTVTESRDSELFENKFLKDHGLSASGSTYMILEYPIETEASSSDTNPTQLVVESVQARVSTRESFQRLWQGLCHFQEAMRSGESLLWVKAIYDEMSSLLQNYS
ncbi:ankyrin repeat-containing protein BDA1-like [Gastrolobium bilobum]|uniref:ankyrin repeat-containing protein BDA1-like n=1 Tax=Gastrolobium bilobum TaxID=150636 RepID=UPI002AB14AEC|nr:ankyrin repeat-containing protein BDA1-like [Gastrolobium bilobum]